MAYRYQKNVMESRFLSAFGAVRKNTLKGYFFTEWILMILCTVIASVLGFNEINGKTFELISWLLIGAASGQYVSEAFGKGKKSVVIAIISTITLLLPFADFILYSRKSSLMIEKPIVIFGIHILLCDKHYDDKTYNAA